MEEISLLLSVSINMKFLGENSGHIKRKCQSAILSAGSNELREVLSTSLVKRKSFFEMHKNGNNVNIGIRVFTM